MDTIIIISILVGAGITLGLLLFAIILLFNIFFAGMFDVLKENQK